MLKEKRIIYPLIFVGAIIVISIIAVIYLYANKDVSQNNIDDQNKELVKDLSFNLQWKDPIKVAPTTGRYSKMCADGTNKGKIWMDLSLDISDIDSFYVCKVDIGPTDNSYIDSFQLNLGKDRKKSAFVGFANEIAIDNNVKVCCKSGDKEFCKTNILKAYC